MIHPTSTSSTDRFSSDAQSLQTLWAQATIAEPLGFVDDELNTVGTFILRAGVFTILSLSPAEDFELNTDIIHRWKLIFQASDGRVFGDADYNAAIKELHLYIIDQQNGSLLIQCLTDNEIEDLYTQTIFD